MDLPSDIRVVPTLKAYVSKHYRPDLRRGRHSRKLRDLILSQVCAMLEVCASDLEERERAYLALVIVDETPSETAPSVPARLPARTYFSPRRQEFN